MTQPHTSTVQEGSTPSATAGHALLGPLTARDITVLGSVLVVFLGSLLPIIVDRYLLNLWNATPLFFLGIGVLLPLLVGSLFLYRRYSPAAQPRVGSLSVDQFASVVAGFATAYFFLATVTTFGPGFLIGLVGSLGLLAATVGASIVPAFAADFTGRPEVPAHPMARDAVPAAAAPKTAVAAGASVKGAAAQSTQGQAAAGASFGAAAADQGAQAPTAVGAAARDAFGASAPAAAWVDGAAESRWAAPATSSAPGTMAFPITGAAGMDAGSTDAPVAAEPEAAEPLAGETGSPAGEPAADAVDDAEAAQSAAADADPAASGPAAIVDVVDADVEPSDAEPVSAGTSAAGAAAGEAGNLPAVDDAAPAEEPAAEEPAAEEPAAVEPVQAAESVEAPAPVHESIGATVDPQASGQPVYDAFWFAVDRPRPVVEESTGAFLYNVEPGNWVLALADRGHDFLVQNTDGRVGVLRDLSGIERAPEGE
ncbi:hypothetical protein [Arthrobacter sp. 35W]|uniref:hypothetical protein n=1 Tax=Arthrobacter sp. 35W TaxID=1132441 RepID=UPI000429EF9A|nr:hypothetical protein [Arthrobacter sp. 35W]